MWELPSLEPHPAAAIVAPRPSSTRRQRTLPSNLTRRGPLASFARESNADPSQPANQGRGRRNKPFPARTTLSTLSTSRELLCTLYHASSRPHSSKAESRLALSINDPAGQCERPSPVYACRLRVLSHPLCRFRQHFAASSTTHLSGSPMSTASAAGHQAYRSIAPARWRTRGRRPLRPAEPRSPPLQQFAANRPDILIQTHRRSNSKQVHSATKTADAGRPRPHLASRHQIRLALSLRQLSSHHRRGKLRLSLPDLTPNGH